jgi:acyl-coenzyme A thioesterase PaaI-like protein
MPPDLSAPDPAWTPLTPFWESLGTRSFVSSDDGDRIRVRYYADLEGATRARAWFGPGAEGPPGHVHGGALAALLDEAMGMAGLATGRVVVAARIEVDFRSMVPLGEVVDVVLEVVETAGAKVSVRAELRRGETVACRATGLFVDIGTDRMGQAAEAVGL